MDQSLKNIVKGSLGILAYFFFNFGAGKILSFIGINANNLSPIKVILISGCFSLIILLILFGLSYKKLLTDLKSFCKNIKIYLGRNSKYWFCSLGIMIISNLLISLIFNRSTSANDQAIKTLFGTFPIYIFISSVIIAPITEELVFRQSIKYLIKNKYAFILISGLAFGFMHILASMTNVADFLYIIPYSAPGIAFAYMLEKEDNVFIPISFHLIHNGLAFILLVIANVLGAI